MISEKNYLLNAKMTEPSDVKARGWDPKQTYDVTSHELKLMEKRSAMRSQLKAHWMKESTNPHIRQFGGHVFDPQVQRWQAAKATGLDHFKPTLKTTKSLFGLVILPMILCGKLYYWEHNWREEQHRSGTIAYQHKFWMLDSTVKGPMW